MKPCMNVDCMLQNNEYKSECGRYTVNPTDCPKYTDTEKESAWEVLKRLIPLNGFEEKLYFHAAKSQFLKTKYNEIDRDDAICFSLLYLLNKPERQAIKIMKEIEKELKE